MVKVRTHKRYASSSIEKIKDWKTSPDLKKLVRKYLIDYENGDVTSRIGSNIETTLERQTQFLKPCIEWIGKKQLTVENMKKLKKSILQDEIKSYHNKPFSLRVKKDMLSSFAKFLDYSYKDKSPSKPLKIKITQKNRDPKSLTLEEVDKLYKHCGNNSQRFLIAMLFGTGARAEEFHNLRLSDITLPEKGDSYVKVRFRDEYSKTEGRTISVYYNKTLEAVRDYLSEKQLEPEDIVFDYSYDNMRAWLARLGRKVLGKNINYHLFRHSTATWLSNRLNRQQLCVYFGWKFSSPMPDVYIKRSGVEMKETDEKFKATELEELKKDLETKNIAKDIEISELQKQMNGIINLIQSPEAAMMGLHGKKFDFEKEIQRRSKK